MVTEREKIRNLHTAKLESRLTYKRALAAFQNARVNWRAARSIHMAANAAEKAARKKFVRRPDGKFFYSRYRAKIGVRHDEQA